VNDDRQFEGNVIFTEEMVNAAMGRLRQKLASQGDAFGGNAETVQEDQMMDCDEQDDDLQIDDLLPFTPTEKHLIAQLGDAVRKRMVSAEPDTLRKIAAFLYALERLPYATSDVSLDLAIMERINENLAYVSVELDGHSFRLSTGGAVYSPDVGGDSFSETVFEIETGGFREGSTSAFSDWLDAFVSASGTIEIQGDDDADLTEPAPGDGWDRLERYWESNVEDTDGW